MKIRIANNSQNIGPIFIWLFFLLLEIAFFPKIFEPFNLFSHVLFGSLLFFGQLIIIVRSLLMRRIDLIGSEIHTSGVLGIVSEVVQLKDIESIKPYRSFATFPEYLFNKPCTFVLTYQKNIKYRSFKFYVKPNERANEVLNYFIREVEKTNSNWKSNVSN